MREQGLRIGDQGSGIKRETPLAEEVAGWQESPDVYVEGELVATGEFEAEQSPCNFKIKTLPVLQGSYDFTKVTLPFASTI